MVQFSTENGIGFYVTGSRPELFHMVKWLSSYGMGDCIKLPKISNTDPITEYTAEVILDRAVDKYLPLEDFAAIFKLTYYKFKIIYKDASNTKSNFIEKIERLSKIAALFSEQGIELNSDTLKEIHKQAENIDN